MNERSFLEPQQVIAQSRDVIRILHAENARLQTAISSSIAFIEDDSTSTKGINRGKQKMQDVVSILKTLILANMCDVRDHQKLIALMEGIDGNLNGRTILSLLRETESNIASFQTRINRARNNLHSSTSFPSVSSTTFDATKRMISKYENILQTQHDLRNYLNSRIDLYNTIEHQSRLLFREAAELRIEAMNGFEMVNEAATGLPNTFHHSGLSAWRTNNQIKRDRFNDVKVKAANEILNLIRKQGIPFPKGWSAANKRDFALKYLAEMQLIEGFIDRNFETRDFGEDADEARAAETAFIFLSDPELSFHMTFEQREELLGILIEHGMWYGPIREFLERENLDHIEPSRMLPVDSFALQAGQTYGAATMGTSHHDWYTFARVGSWLEGAVRIAPAVGIASNWGSDVVGNWSRPKLKPQEASPPPRPTPPANPGKPFDPNNPATEQSNVDPNTLNSGQQRSLRADDLQIQRELINTGTPRTSPIQVHRNGVIFDGHHGVRAAIEAGVPVNVIVRTDFGFPGKVSVIDLPNRIE